MNFELEHLKKTLDLSIIKGGKDNRTSSIVYSKNGESYCGAYISSDTNLLSISSEQVALMRAIQNNNFEIEKVVTLVEKSEKNETASPIVLKILIDFVRRTGQKIKYTVIGMDGNILFSTENISSLFSFYKPNLIKLKKIDDDTIVPSNKVKLKKDFQVEDVLKKYALLGIERNFPTYDSASGYGTAVLTKNNNIYFSGQYSSFDKRMNIHSEMAAVISAFMEKDVEITHIGIVSTKYKDKPTHMCGCCRQFLTEIMSRFNMDMQIFLFAKDTDRYETQNINTYLPNIWTSKNW